MAEQSVDIVVLRANAVQETLPKEIVEEGRSGSKFTCLLETVYYTTLQQLLCDETCFKS